MSSWSGFVFFLLFKQNEQLNIVNILHRYPMSLHGHRSRPESIPIMRQIMQCQVLGNIACSVNLNALDVRDEMLNLMRRGYTLSRAYLRSLLGITEDIVALVRSKMQPEDFVDYSGIARIKQENAKLTSIDDGDIAAILTYYQVRRHLELVNRPYTDCDDNNQVWNVRALMVRPQLPPQTAIVASPSIDFPHRQQPNGWPYDAAIDESELDAFWDNFEYDVDHSEEDEEESDQQSEEQSDEEIEEVSDEESEVSSPIDIAENVTDNDEDDNSSITTISDSDDTVNFDYGSTEITSSDETDDDSQANTDIVEANTSPIRLNIKRRRIESCSSSDESSD